MARLHAARGWDLILTARRQAPLEALATELRARGATVTVLTADLGKPGAAQGLVDQIVALGLVVDGLVNNAGYSRTAGFLATDPAQHADMIRVMLTAPVELSRLLLPGMVSRGFGRILNVASIAGLMPATGGDTLYGPIKGFLIKASQGLHLETRGTGVHVTALCPGYTFTEFHDVNGSREEVTSAYPAWMWMTAEAVARAGYDGVEANRPRVVPGWRNRLLSIIPKILPNDVALTIIAGHARRLKRI